MAVSLTGRDLDVETLLAVARRGAQVELDPGAIGRMRAARAVAERALAKGERVYGLTTGVGARRDAPIGAAARGTFEQALIDGHRVGQGPAAAEEVVRATLLVLANGLAAGTTAARPELAAHVVAALNARRHPTVRLLGSLGQADLAPMADLAHGLLEGFAAAAGEGLALLANNAFTTGLAALALADATRLLDAADVAGALDLEAFGANLSPLHPAGVRARPFPGLRLTVERLRGLLEGSDLWRPGTARHLQDPLSFRCLAQVHGAARDALGFAHAQLTLELNSAQGNPLVVPEEDRLVSVASFDLLPLAAALDLARIGLAPLLTSAAERAIKLLDPAHSGLPAGLAAHAGGADDALDELGVAIQALTAEARLLAAPVSYEVVSSSHARGIEDRMTMAPLGARRLAEQVALGERVLAIGLVIGCQAAELRARPLGRGAAAALAQVRARLPGEDRRTPLPPDLDPIRDLIRSGTLGPP